MIGLPTIVPQMLCGSLTSELPGGNVRNLARAAPSRRDVRRRVLAASASCPRDEVVLAGAASGGNRRCGAGQVGQLDRERRVERGAGLDAELGDGVAAGPPRVNRPRSNGGPRFRSSSARPT